jgi:ubiquinone/menaquinone biosynthesis C-methylase UbiE
MSFTDMSRREVLLHRLALNGLARPTYRRFVAGLGLRGDERVLDFGSGSGAEARYLAPILQRGGGHLTCVDISPVWLAEIKKVLRRYDDVEYRLGRLWELDLPSASYDVIVAHYVLHDIPADERERVVHEFVRLLRPGGFVAARDPSQPGKGLATARLAELMGGAGLERARAWTGRLLGVQPFAAAVYRTRAETTVEADRGTTSRPAQGAAR